MFVNDPGKAKMIEVAQHAVHGFCAYGGGRCDCKYGATAIGCASETGNGCPEMRVIALMLDVMTPAEYARLIKRATKNSSRAYVATGEQRKARSPAFSAMGVRK